MGRTTLEKKSKKISSPRKTILFYLKVLNRVLTKGI